MKAYVINPFGAAVAIALIKNSKLTYPNLFCLQAEQLATDKQSKLTAGHLQRKKNVSCKQHKLVMEELDLTPELAARYGHEKKGLSKPANVYSFVNGYHTDMQIPSIDKLCLTILLFYQVTHCHVNFLKAILSRAFFCNVISES